MTALGFLLPFGHRHSLLGHPVPAGDCAPLTVGLPRRLSGADPDGVSVFRTRETWLAQGALFTPGGGGVHTAGCSPRPPPAASQRPAPVTPDHDPPRGVSVTRHQQGFTVIHPTPAFPSPVTPGGTGSLGFSLSFAPHRARPGNARQGGDRPGHCLDYVAGISQPPFDVLTHHVRPHVARTT